MEKDKYWQFKSYDSFSKVGRMINIQKNAAM